MAGRRASETTTLEPEQLIEAQEKEEELVCCA